MRLPIWPYRPKRNSTVELIVSICSLARMHTRNGMDPVWIDAEIGRVLVKYPSLSKPNIRAAILPLVKQMVAHPEITDDQIRQALAETEAPP